MRDGGGVLGGGDSRFLRMGGGIASSSDELAGESGVCALVKGGCFEFVWQKWKKLLNHWSGKTFKQKKHGLSGLTPDLLCRFFVPRLYQCLDGQRALG